MGLSLRAGYGAYAVCKPFPGDRFGQSVEDLKENGAKYDPDLKIWTVLLADADGYTYYREFKEGIEDVARIVSEFCCLESDYEDLSLRRSHVKTATPQHELGKR